MKIAVIAGWDDVPHLDAKAKEDLLKTYPLSQRKTRTQGIPQFGSGTIYTEAEEDVVVAPFELPAHWPRGYALDPGVRTCAVMFGAHDRETDTAYFYDEIYRGGQHPSVIVSGIKARGEWLRGVVDPSAVGRMLDGRRVIDMFRDMGLDISEADNAVEAGILQTQRREGEGRLKIFSTCKNYIAERRIYRRDENGKVVKSHDHALDAGRYFIMSGLKRCIVDPGKDKNARWWEADKAGGFCG